MSDEGIRGNPSLIAECSKIATKMALEQAEWVDGLRARGVKAAHPDDGWVNRDKSQLHFCYPQFNDGAAVGDVVALGSPQWGSVEPRTRLVRLIARDVSMFGIEWWKFEPVTGA